MKKITFEDKGQDFLEWVLNDDNIVIESIPFQTRIWKGTYVVGPTIKEGKKPQLNLPKTNERRELNYCVIKIEKL